MILEIGQQHGAMVPQGIQMRRALRTARLFILVGVVWPKESLVVSLMEDTEVDL